MTWQNTRRAAGALGVLAGLALVSGADFIDSLASFFYWFW